MSSLVIGMKPRTGKPSMSPPEDGAPPMAKPDAGPAAPEKKHTEAEAHPVRADQHCKDCQNYQAETGECEEVEGMWQPEDACIRFFEPISGGADDDESAETEPDDEDNELQP